MNKRGVSPLTATLLLIVLSAVLGASVMSWGKSYIEERAEFVGKGTPQAVKCGSIDWIRVGGEPQVCLVPQTKTLRFFVESVSGVEHLQARVVGSLDILTREELGSISKGESQKFELDYATIGDIRQVKVTPYLGSGSTREICTPITVDAPLSIC